MPLPSKPFRIGAMRDYAAGEWLGTTSLASTRPEQSLAARLPQPLNPFGTGSRSAARIGHGEGGMDPKDYLDRFTYFSVTNPLTGRPEPAPITRWGSNWADENRSNGAECQT